MTTPEQAKHIEASETIRALREQVEALTASQNTCGSGAGCLHKDASIEVLRSDRDAALALAADRLVDAERLNWLETQSSEKIDDENEEATVWACWAFESPTLREAIDAARQAAKDAP